MNTRTYRPEGTEFVKKTKKQGLEKKSTVVKRMAEAVPRYHYLLALKVLGVQKGWPTAPKTQAGRHGRSPMALRKRKEKAIRLIMESAGYLPRMV